MSRPHLNQVDRDAIEDLGLVENDETEDMRTAPANPSVRALGGGRPATSNQQEREATSW